MLSVGSDFNVMVFKTGSDTKNQSHTHAPNPTTEQVHWPAEIQWENLFVNQQGADRVKSMRACVYVCVCVCVCSDRLTEWTSIAKQAEGSAKTSIVRMSMVAIRPVS